MFKTITRTEKYGNFEKKHTPKQGDKKKKTLLIISLLKRLFSNF